MPLEVKLGKVYVVGEAGEDVALESESRHIRISEYAQTCQHVRQNGTTTSAYCERRFMQWQERLNHSLHLSLLLFGAGLITCFSSLNDVVSYTALVVYSIVVAVCIFFSFANVKTIDRARKNRDTRNLNLSAKCVSLNCVLESTN